MLKSTAVLLSFTLLFVTPSLAIDVSIIVTLGEDRGQALGSLFEARGRDGDVIAGAGFDDAHSTYLRDNNRQVVFFLKSPSPRPTITNLGKPFGPENNGTRLQVADDMLLAFHRAGNAVAFQSLNKGNMWAPIEDQWTQTANAFGGIQSVANKLLVFEGSRIRYDGNVIYDSQLGSGRYYYANGSLFLYHFKPDRLYVTEWEPGETVTLDEAHVFDIVGNVFTYGTYDDEVLVTTNVGEFYSYKEGALTRHRLTDGKSWQGYSMLRYYDKVLIGHYPSGSLYQYDANGLQPFEPAIPFPDSVSSNAREAQTLAIYGGYLYVGVWPWGEVWRFDHEENAWSLVSRVFDQPEMTKDDQEPFARAMANKPAPYNYWGQRVTSLTNFEDSLFVSTMNKQGQPHLPVHDFMDVETVDQYGAIHKIYVPGQITAAFEWKEQTTFRFVADEDSISIYQDGKSLGTARTDPAFDSERVLNIELGTGIYGPLRAEAVRQ